MEDFNSHYKEQVRNNYFFLYVSDECSLEQHFLEPAGQQTKQGLSNE